MDGQIYGDRLFFDLFGRSGASWVLARRPEGPGTSFSSISGRLLIVFSPIFAVLGLIFGGWVRRFANHIIQMPPTLSKFRPKFVLWIPADGLSTSLPYPFFKGRRLPRSGLNSPYPIGVPGVLNHLEILPEISVGIPPYPEGSPPYLPGDHRKTAVPVPRS